MLAATAMLGAAGEATRGPGPGPSGPPTDVTLFSYGGGPFAGVQWVNGDSTASSQIGFSSSPSSEPASPTFTVNPGVTSKQTEDGTVGRFWWVRHKKNSQVTAWVVSDVGFE